jgi:repressor LexA
VDLDLTERQREVLGYIISFNEENGYFPSLREIGSHFSLALGTVQTHLDTLKRKGALNWDKGKTRALRLAPESRMEFGLGATRALADAMDMLVQVPLLGRVSAGLGLLAEEHVEDTLSLPRTFVRYQTGEVFALKVKGDSMIGAGILEGDTVVVRIQAEANNQDIVVALLGEEATVKYLRKEPGRVLLISANPAYPPREVGPDFKILGRVVHLIRHY